MRALLDTHVFLWWVGDDARLSATARQIIGDAANEILLSAASGWEIAIKSRLGRLRVPDNLEQFMSEQMLQNHFTALPIHLSHALGVHRLPPLHRDPFDRILAVQSRLEAMPILTADPLIARYDVETLW